MENLDIDVRVQRVRKRFLANIFSRKCIDIVRRNCIFGSSGSESVKTWCYISMGLNNLIALKC